MHRVDTCKLGKVLGGLMGAAALLALGCQSGSTTTAGSTRPPSPPSSPAPPPPPTNPASPFSQPGVAPSPRASAPAPATQPMAPVVADGAPVKVINTVCPIGGDDFGEAVRPASLAREWKGKTIGFCCEHCVAKFGGMSEAQRDSVLARASANQAPQE